MTSNRAAGIGWRNDLLLYLHSHGVPSAVAPVDGSGSGGWDGGNVVGLPLTISAKNERDISLPEAIDKAQRAAQFEGKNWFVSVQRRRSAPPGEAYVTTTLDVFLQMFEALFPEEVGKPRTLASVR